MLLDLFSRRYDRDWKHLKDKFGILNSFIVDSLTAFGTHNQKPIPAVSLSLEARRCNVPSCVRREKAITKKQALMRIIGQEQTTVPDREPVRSIEPNVHTDWHPDATTEVKNFARIVPQQFRSGVTRESIYGLSKPTTELPRWLLCLWLSEKRTSESGRDSYR